MKSLLELFGGPGPPGGPETDTRKAKVRPIKTVGTATYPYVDEEAEPMFNDGEDKESQKETMQDDEISAELGLPMEGLNLFEFFGNTRRNQGRDGMNTPGPIGAGIPHGAKQQGTDDRLDTKTLDSLSDEDDTNILKVDETDGDGSDAIDDFLEDPDKELRGVLPLIGEMYASAEPISKSTDEDGIDFVSDWEESGGIDESKQALSLYEMIGTRERATKEMGAISTDQPFKGGISSKQNRTTEPDVDPKEERIEAEDELGLSLMGLPESLTLDYVIKKVVSEAGADSAWGASVKRNMGVGDGSEMFDTLEGKHQFMMCSAEEFEENQKNKISGQYDEDDYED